MTFRGALSEFGAFFVSQIACSAFAIFIFASAAVTRVISFGIPRYDVLLLLCAGYQFYLVRTRRESWSDFGCIAVFHLLGLCLETYKIRHGSWTYPEFAYTKLVGVPAFSGFMYASIASYVIQAHRRFGLGLTHWPTWPWLLVVVITIYANFYLNRYFGDIRWPISVIALAIFWRCRVSFLTVPGRRRTMPMALAFVLIGFFVWVAEQICTFLGVWQYPDQVNGWVWVGLGKWSSWSLLVIVGVSVTLEWIRRFGAVPNCSRE